MLLVLPVELGWGLESWWGGPCLEAAVTAPGAAQRLGTGQGMGFWNGLGREQGTQRPDEVRRDAVEGARVEAKAEFVEMEGVPAHGRGVGTR